MKLESDVAAPRKAGTRKCHGCEDGKPMIYYKKSSEKSRWYCWECYAKNKGKGKRVGAWRSHD